MKKHDKDILQQQLDNEKAVLKKLEQNYKDALGEINSRLAELLGRSDANLQHVIYQINYQKTLKAQVEAILKQLQANEFQTVSEYLAQSYEDGFISSMYAMQKQGVPLVLPIDQEMVVQAIQHETKLSEELYTALGKDTKKLQKQIASEISRGITNAAMFSEIARNISSYAGISKNNAMRIARTEGHRIQCKASMDACKKAKSKGADVVKQWDSTLDGKTRDSHRKINGEIRELDEKFSNGLRYPGDPRGKAEEVINCRCTLLQRARWALGNEYTKWSKDAPVVIDDDGTTQFVILSDAENYKQFKERYKKVTERVRKDARKISDKVTLLEEYETDGVTYKVDGRHVLADSKPYEKEIAKIISEEIGEEIMIVPRVVFPQGISTPDYIIDNKKFDLKAPKGNGKHVLYNMINSKKKQADNFIFDISNCPLDFETIEGQVKEIYSSTHTKFVKEIIIIKDGKIIKKYNKDK